MRKEATRIIITPQCRLNRGKHEAFGEAVLRLAQEFTECEKGWGDKANYHIVLEIEPIVAAE